MKIEIELHEIERLREDANIANDKAKKLEDELKANDEKQWERKAVKLSEILFNKYMEFTFMALGFDQKDNLFETACVSFPDYWSTENWLYKKDGIKMQLSAHVTSEFKKAFLRMWIPNEPLPEKKSVLQEL